MKVVAMIPVKLGSKRVEGKNTKEFFDGTPLVAFIQRACLRAASVGDVYVYCGDDAIVEYVEPGVTFVQRPKYLDGDECNCNDIIREFMKAVDADIYVVCHATGPFTKPDSIDACVRAVAGGEYDSAFLAKRMQAFLWKDGKALNFDPQHFPRTQDLEPIFVEASGAFAFPRTTFAKYDRRVGEKPYIHVVDDVEAIDIDYPLDFVIADAVYREVKHGERSD